MLMMIQMIAKNTNSPITSDSVATKLCFKLSIAKSIYCPCLLYLLPQQLHLVESISFCLCGELNVSIFKLFMSGFLFHLCYGFRVDWEETVSKKNVTQLKASGTSTDYLESIDIDQERSQYIMIYTCLISLGVLTFFCRSFSFFRMCLRISINLHRIIFDGVSRAKMIFFHNNPSGRILNRFSKDINNVDTLLPITMIDICNVSTFV